MVKYSLLAILALSSFSIALDTALGMPSAYQDVTAVTNCSGTQVVRVQPGKFEVRHVAANLPGCIKSTTPQPIVVRPTPVTVSTGMTNTGVSSTGTLIVTTGSIYTGSVSTGLTITPIVTSTTVTNCNGTQILSLTGGAYAITRVQANLPGCISVTATGVLILDRPHINLSRGPLLDLTSTDIVNYRTKLLKEKSIRFANVVRSVRIRNQASIESRTNAYLLDNDAVVIEGKETGWVKVQGADVVVTDTHENIVESDTTGRASGYTASKYLRDPNTTDLVRIEQADHAYWSDIAHVNVRHANVRANPNYTAAIVTTLSKGVSLYVVATVDNWSEVRNDEGTLRGYIRSDLLTVDRAQRVDNPNTGKRVMTSSSSQSSSDSSWIGF